MNFTAAAAFLILSILEKVISAAGRIGAINNQEKGTEKMTRKYIEENKRRAVAVLQEATPDKETFREIWPIVDYLQRAGARLHTLYEHSCNGYSPFHSGYWNESDDAKVDKFEFMLRDRAREFGFSVTNDVNEKRPGLWLRLQSDPRGWPVEIIYIPANDSYKREIRLGGK